MSWLSIDSYDKVNREELSQKLFSIPLGVPARSIHNDDFNHKNLVRTQKIKSGVLTAEASAPAMRF